LLGHIAVHQLLPLGARQRVTDQRMHQPYGLRRQSRFRLPLRQVADVGRREPVQPDAAKAGPDVLTD
jgi:hypothetical protein